VTTSLFRVMVKQPELLLDHAQAYAELFESELSTLGAAYGRRAGLYTAMLCCLTMGATLSGVAIMLVSVTPLLPVYAPWTLGLVPILPFGAAYWCNPALKASAVAPFEVIRHQIRTDMQVLRAQARS